MICAQCGRPITQGLNLGFRLGRPFVVCGTCAHRIATERREMASGAVALVILLALAALWLALTGCTLPPAPGWSMDRDPLPCPPSLTNDPAGTP